MVNKTISAPLGILIVLVIGIPVFQNCSNNGKGTELIEVSEITKWPDGYQAAYTPTFDTGLPSMYDVENQWLLDNGLFIDYEIVTASYDIRPERVTFLRDSLMPLGFGIFGHGHAHDHHDRFTYEEAYNSFRQNYLSIKSYGIEPVAYAYPYGAGLRDSTRLALKNSGFLSGRLNQTEFEGYGPCIMPGDETEPPDWFGLPALRMEDYDFEQCEHCINDTEEFFSYFDPCVEQGAWLISTYHAIGFDGETDGRPVGWGFYRRENFFEEMTRIKELQDQGIVWLAQMSEATLYSRQRHNASFSIDRQSETSFHLYLDDGLDREIYTMPLTLKLQLDDEILGHSLSIFDADGTLIEQFESGFDEMLINLHPSDRYNRIEIDIP